MTKPTYAAVEHHYLFDPEYVARRFPCNRVVNQCAIRMSIALQRSGFTLDGFPRPDRIHGTPANHCSFHEPHIVGATELMRFLIASFHLTVHYSHHRVSEAYAGLQNRRGIVYFENLGGGKGDHIDLFNGTAIFNEIRDYPDYGHEGGVAPTDPANAGRYTEHHYFRRAQLIDFIELP